MCELDVVQTDIPALLGTNILDRESLIANTVANRLRKPVGVEHKYGTTRYVDEWSVPVYRAHGNDVLARINFPSKVNFSRAQLLNLHKLFFHPSVQKLLKLRCRARPEVAPPGTLEMLQDPAKRCDPCLRIHNAPTHFRVCIGAENVRFNERVLLDSMYINGKPVLHIVDEGPHFSSAKSLPDVSTKTLWTTLLKCWAKINTGLPHRMLVDLGSAFGPLCSAIQGSAWG